MALLMNRNQSCGATKETCNIFLRHGFRLFFQPCFVPQLREFDRDITVNGNDWFNPEVMKMVSKELVSASNFVRKLKDGLLFELSFKPLSIIESFVMRPRTATMESSMKAMRKYLKVFGTIIKSVSVDVMDRFPIYQKAAEFLFSDKPVKKDVTVVRFGVVGFPDDDVPHIHRLATFPSWMLWTDQGMCSEAESWHWNTSCCGVL
jgi:hypothetical protein